MSSTIFNEDISLSMNDNLSLSQRSVQLYKLSKKIRQIIRKLNQKIIILLQIIDGKKALREKSSSRTKTSVNKNTCQKDDIFVDVDTPHDIDLEPYFNEPIDEHTFHHDTDTSTYIILNIRSFKRRRIIKRNTFLTKLYILECLSQKLQRSIKDPCDHVEQARQEYSHDNFDMNISEEMLGTTSSLMVNPIDLFSSNKSSDTDELSMLRTPTQPSISLDIHSDSTQISFNQKFQDADRRNKVSAFCKLIKLAHENRITVYQTGTYGEIFFELK